MKYRLTIVRYRSSGKYAVLAVPLNMRVQDGITITQCDTQEQAEGAALLEAMSPQYQYVQ